MAPQTKRRQRHTIQIQTPSRLDKSHCGAPKGMKNSPGRRLFSCLFCGTVVERLVGVSSSSSRLSCAIRGSRSRPLSRDARRRLN